MDDDPIGKEKKDSTGASCEGSDKIMGKVSLIQFKFCNANCGLTV